MDTKRDIYGEPVRDLDGNEFAHDDAYVHQHQHRDANGNEYTYSHSHPYADKHEHPDTAFHSVSAADSDAV